MPHSILLISDNKDDEKFASCLSQSLQMNLKPITDFEKAADFIQSDAPPVILVAVENEESFQSFEDVVQEKLGLFSDSVQPNDIHFISSKDLDEIPYVVDSPLFGNFVLRNYPEAESASKVYSRLIQASLQERPFGLSCIFQNQTKIQKVKLQQTQQKQKAVEAVRKYLLGAGFKPRMAAVISNAVDELLMNAMFDAPTDEIGTTLYSSTSRSSERELKGKDQVEMEITYDGEYVAISAIDHFGSLDKGSLMSHIAKVYKSEEYKVRTSTASAGIGLATVFRSGGALFFASEKGVRTEVTVFFRKLNSYRAFKDQFRFISTQFYF